jgi:hypothetical protein
MKKLLLISILLLAGCSSKPKKETAAGTSAGPAASGIKWDTKAQVRDYRNNKTNNLSIDVISVKNTHLRMEVSATLGYPVASYVAGPQSLKMAIYTQKKFYFGPNSEEALTPLLGFPLDPNVFQSIVYDSPIRNWHCEAADDGLVAACKHMTKYGEVVVAWQDRKEDSKRVVIHGPKFEMEWQFKGSTVVNPVKPKVFELEAPSGYKVIPL